jgi:acyl-coenzyme A thioesterase PaaI-like protein
MVPQDTSILALRDQYASCFGCGLENETGLRLDGFEVDGNTVAAVFEPPERFQGFDGVLHGGVVATALDEISAWAAMLTNSVFVFTAKLEISYRKPAPLGAPLILRGTVFDRRGKRLRIDADIMDGETVLAQSHGLFMVAKHVEQG